jgi:O-antigen/teichoic acid export membrane protein
MLAGIQQRFSKALSSRFLRSAGTISGGAALTQMIAFGTAPILTRLYSPESYGLLALLLGFVTFGVAIASLHYEMAIALPKKDEDAASLSLLAVFLGTSFAVLTVLLFAPALGNLLGKAGFDQLVRYWWLLPISLFATAIHQALMLWHLRKQRFKEVAGNNISQSLTQNGGPILFAWMGLTGIGLLLGLTLSRVVAAAGFAYRAFKQDRSIFHGAIRNLWHQAKEYRSFPTVGLIGAALHIACFQLPVFLLTDLYGAHAAGFYMLQDRVLGVPLAVLAQGVASVFYVNAARMANEDPLELRRSYFKLLKNLTLSGIVPTLVLLALAPWLFKTVFGKNWEIAGEFARIMAIPTLLRFIAGPLFRCLTILKHQTSILVWDGIGLITMLMLPGYLAKSMEPTRAGVLAVAIAISLTYAGLLASATWAVVQRSRNGQRDAILSRSQAGAEANP